MKKYFILLLPISQLLLAQSQETREQKEIRENIERASDYLTKKKCTAYVAPGVSKVFSCYNLGGDITSGAFHREVTSSLPYAYGVKVQYGALGNEEHRSIPGSKDIGTRGVLKWLDETAKEKFEDPCPKGFRLPTISEFEGLAANNKFEAVGTFTDNPKETDISAIYILNEKGERTLMFQASGYRSTAEESQGTRTGYNQIGAFWSSTASDSKHAYALSIGQTVVSKRPVVQIGTFRKTDGLSVRCIQK